MEDLLVVFWKVEFFRIRLAAGRPENLAEMSPNQVLGLGRCERAR
jgi:hypothetical protein